jgi:hypothetical protein
MNGSLEGRQCLTLLKTDLIISKDSDVTTSSSVQFEIKDFNEKKVLSRHNQYDVTLTAVVSNWIVQSSIPSRPSKGGSTTVSKSSLFKNDDELIEYLLGKINNIYTI